MLLKELLAIGCVVWWVSEWVSQWARVMCVCACETHRVHAIILLLCLMLLLWLCDRLGQIIIPRLPRWVPQLKPWTMMRGRHGEKRKTKKKMGSWSQSHKFRFGMEWRSWGEILKSVSLQFEYISYEQNPFIKYCLKFMLTIILSISQCIGTIKFNCKRNRRNFIEL